MAKFNVVQKRKRAQVAAKKRATHGDPLTGKLKTKPQPLSVSGKRQRKILKKWRREHKEAIEKGLVTFQDVEMTAAADEDTSKEGTSSKDAKRASARFNVKKGVKLKQLKHKGKKKGNSKLAAEASVDAMVE